MPGIYNSISKFWRAVKTPSRQFSVALLDYSECSWTEVLTVQPDKGHLRATWLFMHLPQWFQ